MMRQVLPSIEGEEHGKSGSQTMAVIEQVEAGPPLSREDECHDGW